MSETLYDVAIVGYGPAGEVLAATLARAGRTAVVVERWPQPYPLPRLTTLDGEACRVVQACCDELGDGDHAFRDASVQDACHFVDHAGEPLMVVRYPGRIGGWPSRMSVFQPDFEQAIADAVSRQPQVTLLRGWEAVELAQDEQQVRLTIQPAAQPDGTAAAQRRTLRAKYLVGTDGTRSLVRQAAGIAMRDFDLHERWLNFDAEVLRPLPAGMSMLKIFMDPARPHMHMPIGTRRLRLECRVMEDESDEQMTEPAVAWDFLRSRHGLGPQDLKLLRQVVYHYHTRVADRWRVGRVFIAGDAAHTMPPYMGQGGCSAIRDGRNLGWKLAEVLAGRSGDALLDTYQAEREPHVTTLVMGSDMLGRAVNVTDPEKAAQRNAGMRLKGEAVPPELPSLTSGVLQRAADGTPVAPAGKVAPQSRLRRGDVQARGDALLGTGFQLWSRQAPRLGASARAVLDRLGCTVAVFDDPAAPNAVEDLDGDCRGFLDAHGVDALLVRPDFYAFGGCAADALDALVEQLARQLHATAVAAPDLQESLA